MVLHSVSGYPSPLFGPWPDPSVWTLLALADQVNVVYYDSPIFDKINNETRCCNECLTFCCGGNGQRVQIVSRPLRQPGSAESISLSSG